jgi:ATP-dependent DNA ligase
MLMKPMLFAERAEPFDDGRYLYEPLIDGHRLLLTVEGGRTRLLSRHGYDVTRQYPELHRVPLRKPVDAVLDGEVAYVNPATGRAEFDTLQRRYRMTRFSQILDGKKEFPVTYFVFDMLRYNNIDLRDKPLAFRKMLLRRILDDNAHFKVLGYAEREGRKMCRLAERAGLEGIACKRKDSRYEEGPGDGWLKIPLPSPGLHEVRPVVQAD